MSTIGCGDSSCLFDVLNNKPKGMTTNGGCRCLDKFEVWIEDENRWNHSEISEIRRAIIATRNELILSKYEAQALKQELAEVKSELDTLRAVLSNSNL